MRILEGGRLPILSWAPELDATAHQQAVNLANLAVAIDHVALMPDAHAGFGMPIGGVLFADRAVVPFAIGVDIGCGVALAATDLRVRDLPPERLDRVLAAIERRVPTGHRGHERTVDREAALAEIGLERPESIRAAWLDQGLQQLGTLGGGNHFLELQRDPEGHVYVMLHSGSRHLGKTICDEMHRRAVAHDAAHGLALPHRELAYFPEGSTGFDDYWSAMTFALRYAEVNRARMLDAVEAVLAGLTRLGRFERRVEIHHNYAVRERHAGLDGIVRDGIVHRKGAVRARPGEPVLIPGSMGSASYVGEGLGNPAAFATCEHGAGRAMSRTAARRARSSPEVYDEMDRLGIRLRAADRRAVAEEAAFAYKEIEVVMAASADLVRPTLRLLPLGVVKG